MNHPIRSLLLSTLCLLTSACSSSIAPEDEVPDGMAGAQIEHQADGSVTHTQIDATDEATWIFLDLDGGGQLAEGDADWDLAFQRYHIKMNGGVSGDAGVEAAILEGMDFTALREAPVEGWKVDAPDGDDQDSTPDYVLGTWYAYDSDTHLLTPRDEVYVVRSSEGEVFKLLITDYYNAAGTSGHLSFSWARL